MKTFIYSLLTVVATLALLFTISLALDLQFIQRQVVRALLVYLTMIVVLYLGINILILINKQK